MSNTLNNRTVRKREYVEFDAKDDRGHTLTVIEQSNGSWLLYIGQQDEGHGMCYHDVFVASDDLDTLMRRVRPAIRRNRKRKEAEEQR